MRPESHHDFSIVGVVSAVPLRAVCVAYDLGIVVQPVGIAAADFIRHHEFRAESESVSYGSSEEASVEFLFQVQAHK